MTSTIETVLFDLKHHKSFLSPLTDVSDPYIQSMYILQAFTDSVIHSLEAREPNILEFAQNKTLEHLYTGFPSFHEPVEFKSWVEDATLKHPQRRIAKQHQHLHIVELQSQQTPSTSVVDIVISAVSALEDWRERAYNPSNLVQDPEALYFFIHKNGLKTLSFDDGNGNAFANDNDIVQHGDECLICANAFHTKTNISQKAPCGHIFCAPCFRSWLHKSWIKRTYTCPHCRACLICGRNPCAHHKLPMEPVVPVPLLGILDTVLLGRLGRELHGMTAERYWVLREGARGDRVMLAEIRKSLGVTEGRHELRVLEGMEKEYAHRVRGQIVTAALEGHGIRLSDSNVSSEV